MYNDFHDDDLIGFVYTRVPGADDIPEDLIKKIISGENLLSIQPGGSLSINTGFDWPNIIENIRYALSCVAAVAGAYSGMKLILKRKPSEDEIITDLRHDPIINKKIERLSDDDLRHFIRFVISKTN